MSRKAIITLEQKNWSGWDGGSVKTWSRRLQALRGQALRPECLGLGDDRRDPMGYEVLVEVIAETYVRCFYQRLVIDNPDGTIDLTAVPHGRFVLHPGEHVKLSTPTMDAGTGVIITLDKIREIADAGNANAQPSTLENTE